VGTGGEGQTSGCAGEALTHLKNLACRSIFLVACDSILGGGRSRIKTALSQPQL
jgi:hypothetical protein